MTHWSDRLVALGACPGGLTYARRYDTAQEAWGHCRRGDRMLWWLGVVAGPPWSDSRRPLVGAAAECVALAPVCDDPASEMARCWALGAAMRWARGKCDEEELRAAAAAVDPPIFSCVLVGAHAAAVIAYAATVTAHVERAVNATLFAANDDPTGRVLARCADIVRRWCPNPPEKPK